MSMRRSGSLFSIAAALLFVAVSPQASAALSVTFNGGAITVHGLTPNASLLVFAVTSEKRDWMESVGQVAAVAADADGDGVVTYSMPDGGSIPARSVWAFADLANGAFLIAGPGSYVPEQVPWPATALQRNTAGDIVTLAITGSQWLEIAVVRPQSGAWTATSFDGGSGDTDGVNNGTIVRGFAGMTAQSGPAASPDHLQNGDVVIVFDPGTMRCYATAVTQ
jgi:hypothetical protein